MLRHKNFAHIPVNPETKEEIDELKKKLQDKYPNITYEEMMKIFLEKNKNIVMTENELKRLLAKSRGVII